MPNAIECKPLNIRGRLVSARARENYDLARRRLGDLAAVKTLGDALPDVLFTHIFEELDVELLARRLREKIEESDDDGR